MPSRDAGLLEELALTRVDRDGWRSRALHAESLLDAERARAIDTLAELRGQIAILKETWN